MRRFVKCAAGPGLAAALLILSPSASSAPPVAAACSQDQAAKLDQLIEAWKKAQQDFSNAVRAAKTDDERKAVMEKAPKASDHLPAFIEVAESAAGTDTAAKAWMMVLSLAMQIEDVDAELLDTALETLTREHLASKEVVELPGRISAFSRTLGAEKTESALRQLVDKATVPALKGGAMYTLASFLNEQNPAPDSERAKEVRKLMETVVKDFADVKDSRGRPIGKRAEGWLFEKDHLQVGNSAPEIEATDLSGVAFKLSDYKGEVVLLDFWGNW
jgi:hypothetical protein